jgi:hypothetical protein
MPHVDPAKTEDFHRWFREDSEGAWLTAMQWWYNMVAFACREAKTMNSQSRM